MLPLTGEGFLPRLPTAPDRARSQPAGASIAFAIVVHALVFAAASRIAWTRVEPEPRPQSEVVWLSEWPRREPPVAVEAPAVPLETPPRPVNDETPLPPSPPADPGSATAPSAAAPEPVPAPSSPPARRPVRSTDWNEERRRAIDDVLARRARVSDFAAPSVEALLEARPPPVEPPPSRSIFDSPSRSSGRALLQPGLARTKLGRRIGELCSALGGIGFFGLASCGAPPDDEPSGLFPEVMPEWLTLMPECVETRPLAPLLAESSPFPTVKCRLVPKEGEEALSPR